mmetsp:Transcript_6537/g.15864  ORF Transcript_6537/g.15864 Transcript_6537/m.15864 type:complete len:82 (+) Transcript_6537:810-1055(+)
MTETGTGVGTGVGIGAETLIETATGGEGREEIREGEEDPTVDNSSACRISCLRVWELPHTYEPAYTGKKYRTDSFVINNCG